MSAFDQLYGSYNKEQKGFFDDSEDNKQAVPVDAAVEEPQPPEPQEEPISKPVQDAAEPGPSVPEETAYETPTDGQGYVSPWLANDKPYEATYEESPAAEEDDGVPDWAKEDAASEEASPVEAPENLPTFEETAPELMAEGETVPNKTQEPKSVEAQPDMGHASWQPQQWDGPWVGHPNDEPPYQIPFPQGPDMSFAGAPAGGQTANVPPQQGYEQPLWPETPPAYTPPTKPPVTVAQPEMDGVKGKGHKEKKTLREKRQKKKKKYDDFDDDVVEKDAYDPNEALRREIAEATAAEKKKRKRERDELTKKEKQQEQRKKKMQRPAKKSGGNANAVMRALLCATLACVMMITGYQRIQTANALIGSTVWEDKGAAVGPEIPIDDPSISDNSGDVPEIKEPIVYKYIDEDRLDDMSATALAVWYLTEFPEGKAVNEQALAEYNDWFAKKSSDASFTKSYKDAIAYVKEHPEMLEPAKPEVKPDDSTTADDTPQQPSTPDNPTNPNGAATNPSTPSTGGQTTTGGQPQTGSGTTTGKYTNIPETELNSYSAAQVANWVFKTFPPDGTSWNYQALTDYYSWLDAKDANFRALVNGHLSVMGWTAGVSN